MTADDRLETLVADDVAGERKVAAEAKTAFTASKKKTVMRAQKITKLRSSRAPQAFFSVGEYCGSGIDLDWRQ